MGRKEAVPDGSWSMNTRTEVGKSGSEGSLKLRDDMITVGTGDG